MICNQANDTLHLMKIIATVLVFAVFMTNCHGAGAGPIEEEKPELPVFKGDSGRTYYLSSSGDDSSDGLSPGSSWKTINKLNSYLYDFEPGDTILFRRGDEFKGNLNPVSGTAEDWIRYGAYGTGEKPLLTGSVSMDSIDDWILHRGDIWRSAEVMSRDVGALFMNADFAEIGERKWSVNDLKENGDFFMDPTGKDNSLYLYCEGGSPANAYSGIEASLKEHIINLDDRSYVLFENLHLSRGAAHGFGGSDTYNIIIRSCELSYIGGGFLHDNGSVPVRYGNGIEFWGNAETNLVEGNLFYEIYDTAVTNQNHSRISVQRNLFYINNIIINCGLASFELWNRPSSSLMENIYFLHNTSINPGFGWGGALHRRDRNSFHIASYYNESRGGNLVIRNNIFHSSQKPPGAEYHLFFFDEDVRGSMDKYFIDYNLWFMPDPLWAVTESAQYSSLGEWRDATGLSQQGLDADPRFIDFSMGNYELQNISPAIDSGSYTLRQSDYYGRKNRGRPDMGALELQ